MGEGIISDRDFILSAAGAHTAFGLSKPVAFVGAAHDQQSAALLFPNHKIGNIEVISLVDGRKIFDRAIADKIAVTGTHWLLPSVGTIARDGNGYAFTPAE